MDIRHIARSASACLLSASLAACSSSDSGESRVMPNDEGTGIAGLWFYTGISGSTGQQESRFWDVDENLKLSVYALDQAFDCYNLVELGLVPLGGDEYDLVDADGESIFRVEGSEAETNRVGLSVVRSGDSLLVTTLPLDDVAQRYFMSGVSTRDLNLC